METQESIVMSNEVDTYKARFPHCDSNILHAPKKCIYCDEYPEEQAKRIADGINFTGEQDPNKTKCPAEEARALKMIEQWPGNVPKNAESEARTAFDFDSYNGIKNDK